MDEYLFIVLAKLRADRLKLEREARAGSFGRRACDDAVEQPQERRSPRARRVNPGLERFEENLLGSVGTRQRQKSPAGFPLVTPVAGGNEAAV